ncbi:hypothetical protein RA279_27775, partial [Pseudomonas syringae pv. tagetis]|uniref:hypothetical protein n=1 Tax=Pseudomonas syringae group genomosp. 7 TaxID=251699 RepID=UPI0037705AB8
CCVFWGVLGGVVWFVGFVCFFVCGGLLFFCVFVFLCVCVFLCGLVFLVVFVVVVVVELGLCGWGCCCLLGFVGVRSCGCGLGF